LRKRLIQLTDDEAEALRALAEAIGAEESNVLQDAVRQGLQELRLEHGIRAYRRGEGSAAAAAIVGIGRAEFLEHLASQGVIVIDSPSTVAEELAALAESLDDQRLSQLATRLKAAR
jgi:hypothetical protein